MIRRPSFKAAVVGAIAGVLSNCGAADDSAPPDPVRTHCKTIDERLGPLLQLAEDGKTGHLAAVIATRLDHASQRAFVQLVLDVAYAMPAGTAEKLPKLLAPEGLGALLPLIVALLETLPGDPTAQPPLPPHIAELTAFAAVAQSCLSGELFVLGARVWRDPKTSTSLNVLLSAGPQGAGQLLGAVQSAGAQGRVGFQALVNNLSTSLAQPTFDAQPLLALLDRLVDPIVPGVIGALRDLLRVATVGDTPKDKVQAAKALRGFALCLLGLDPDQLIAGHLYDVLASADPTAARLPANIDSADFLPLLATATEVLASKPAATDAWNELLGLILRPDVAVAALPELVGLLKSDALPGAFALLGDLVAQPCRTQASP